MKPAGDGPPAHNEPVDLEAALADLLEPSPDDFALRLLLRVGIPEERYDRYATLESPAGQLYVAYRDTGVTAAALDTVTAECEEFESRYRSRTGRSAIRTSHLPPGARTALRTGRPGRLAVDLGGLPAEHRAALAAVRTIPRGQLRPLSWVAREAGLTGGEEVLDALAVNPIQVFVPCHRVSDDAGAPCDIAFGPVAGDLLREAEGIDLFRVRAFAASQTMFLGSDTTRIYCHPTCAHARRITRPHQVPFRTAGDASRAGYRPCKSCRPVAA